MISIDDDGAKSEQSNSQPPKRRRSVRLQSMETLAEENDENDKHSQRLDTIVTTKKESKIPMVSLVDKCLRVLKVEMH